MGLLFARLRVRGHAADLKTTGKWRAITGELDPWAALRESHRITRGVKGRLLDFMVLAARPPWHATCSKGREERQRTQRMAQQKETTCLAWTTEGAVRLRDGPCTP